MANPGQVGFAVANPLLAKVMPCIQANLDIQIQCLLTQYRKANLHKQIQCLQRQHRSLFAGFKVFHYPGISTVLLPVGARNSDTSPRQRYLHPCLLVQLSRCSYSFTNHPGILLPGWEFTLRDCCAIMATIGI